MKLEDLIVGETYLNSVNEKVKILFLGNQRIMVESGVLGEYSKDLSSVLESWKLIPKKREAIELFPYLLNNGGVTYLNKEGRNPVFEKKVFNDVEFIHVSRITNIPSLYIDAETFEIVE
jgi:hypothetical protein